MKISKLYLCIRAIPKTIIFNLKYFPLKEALRVPVIVSHRVKLSNLGGTVKILHPHPLGVRLGFNRVGIFDRSRSYSIWEVAGSVTFAGSAKIGHGSKISVARDGSLSIGANFVITAESVIIADKQVEIGDDVLISWNVQIMDTDYHNLYDSDGRVVNPPSPVIIQNKVWIGCRSLILKGVTLPCGTVVAAGTTVTKSPTQEHCVIASSRQIEIKRAVTW